MSGHSKWSQIKRQKAVTDAVKSKTFSRFSQLIALESKHAGGDVTMPALKTAIDRAKAANMPKNNIDRAVAKGISKDATTLERIMYECYGPGGVAILIDVLTDNKNRTTQEIKHLLLKREIELASPGAAVWAFKKTDDNSYVPNEQTLLTATPDDEEKISDVLSSLDEHDDVQCVYTNAIGYEDTGD
ncbi:MAG TPA: YebC/PmpR family DNA-binding transcriptional regulator [Candidatus Kaiserbacteria bacterium]|nr:YebC/PmpR family DNA-binding transcriptional regulator [Candidatus Kaiserbacteria bacterium]